MGTLLDHDILTTSHQSQFTEIVADNNVTLDLIAQEVRDVAQTCNETTVGVTHFLPDANHPIANQIATVNAPHSHILVPTSSEFITIVGVEGH